MRTAAVLLASATAPTTVPRVILPLHYLRWVKLAAYSPHPARSHSSITKTYIFTSSLLGPVTTLFFLRFPSISA
jgi:hypothetical protein